MANIYDIETIILTIMTVRLTCLDCVKTKMTLSQFFLLILLIITNRNNLWQRATS